jgi:hypothetical protein
MEKSKPDPVEDLYASKQIQNDPNQAQNKAEEQREAELYNK